VSVPHSTNIYKLSVCFLTLTEGKVSKRLCIANCLFSTDNHSTP